MCGHYIKQEQEAEEAGAAPNDIAEEKLPGSGSEDSDDENSLVRMHCLGLSLALLPHTQFYMIKYV